MKNPFPKILIGISVFFSLSGVSFGNDVIYESFVSKLPAADKIAILGLIPGAQFGSTLSSGDYNGDGIEDLAVGAPFASREQAEWNGMVVVILGRSTFDMQTIDFTQVAPDFTLNGETSGDLFGSSLSSGDYNNDGISDLAIGAYNAYKNGERPGKVYVYFGKSTLGSQTLDKPFSKPDLVLTGESDLDAFGLSLSTQDLNSDSIDDLAIGSPFASNARVDNAGNVYVYYGGAEKMSTLFDLIFYGLNEGERFGSAISGGDINADGRGDLMIGSYFARGELYKQIGKVYVYTNVYLDGPLITDYTQVLSGAETNEWFGFALSTGDLNSDGYDDLAVASFPYSGERSKAKISVFKGSKMFDEEYDMIVSNPDGDALIGASLDLEDLNADGMVDFVLGAPGVGINASEDAGNVYIIDNSYLSNSTDFSIKDYDFTAVIHGENADDWFGYAIDVLDINNDGYRDLAVGSRYADSDHGVNTGNVNIIFGSEAYVGDETAVPAGANTGVMRGEFISTVINKFDLKTKRAEEIRKCYDHKEFCLFNFLAMSSYDEIEIDPEVILYPDVGLDHEYYEDITLGTMLGLINGYLSEENSPFHSERPISRIQALKVVLGAANLVPPKYRFELIDILGSLENLNSQPSYFADVDPQISYMWWYPRYVNFAFESDIIGDEEFFRPDEEITKSELDDMIERTIIYINGANEETES